MKAPCPTPKGEEYKKKQTWCPGREGLPVSGSLAPAAWPSPCGSVGSTACSVRRSPLWLSWLHSFYAPAPTAAILVGSGCHNKVLQTAQLKQQKFIFSSSGGWKSKLKVHGGLVSPEASLIHMEVAICLLRLGVASPLCLGTLPIIFYALVKATDTRMKSLLSDRPRQNRAN